MKSQHEIKAEAISAFLKAGDELAENWNCFELYKTNKQLKTNFNETMLELREYFESVQQNVHEEVVLFLEEHKNEPINEVARDFEDKFGFELTYEFMLKLR